MSNPVINPLWIYIINVAGNLSDFVDVISTLLLVGAMLGTGFYIIWRYLLWKSSELVLSALPVW